MEIYEKFGVKEYWILFPENACIDAFTLVDGKYKIFIASDIGNGKVNSKLLGGLDVQPGKIFG
ncbi:Uma2 family endonuclease [Leptospira sp. GIMC2001]|uniref:Uma2 family endonuclease n=1 Tax=Leptospira sp. GIMC2001 TaxID=1513297 RepID=UPI00234B3286|nr:Uma2 family endonuclease [Leptospira sp. GIMC2001]WCL49662.1 Uma2 family endonuclease [Leptospira sp. GIMC2001]